MVRIRKYDDLHIQVITDDRAYIADLKAHFTDFVEGYRFQPKFRNGGWDGKICLVSSGNVLPYGLLFDVMSFHKKNYKNKELKIDNEVKEFFSGVDIEPEYDLNILPRGYQIECIEAALKYKRCIMRVATAGGKSLIISYIIKNLIDTNNIKNAIIIVPTQSLVEQFFKDMNDYGMCVDKIGRVYSKMKEFDRQIVISTWQSLSRNIQLVKKFDCVICDEVHGVRANEIRKILSQATNADFRMGFTGTLPQVKLDMFNIKGLLGPVVKQFGSTELANQGYITHCKIICMNVLYKNEYVGDYDQVKESVFINPKRLSLIKDIISSVNDNILVLVGKVEKEGKILEEYLKDIENKEIVFIWGDTPVEEREKWRLECEKRKNIVLIATYGIMSVGVNIPSLKYILFASPFKSKIRVLQSIGRSLRLHTRKTKSIIYDISDDVLFLKDHSMKRMRYYDSEKFEVENITYDTNKFSLLTIPSK